MESETGQHARRLALGENEFSRPEAGRQKNSVSGPGSWIGAEDGWFASNMNDSNNTFCARHLRMRISSYIYGVESESIVLVLWDCPIHKKSRNLLIDKLQEIMNTKLTLTPSL